MLKLWRAERSESGKSSKRLKTNIQDAIANVGNADTKAGQVTYPLEKSRLSCSPAGWKLPALAFWSELASCSSCLLGESSLQARNKELGRRLESPRPNRWSSRSARCCRSESFFGSSCKPLAWCRSCPKELNGLPEWQLRKGERRTWSRSKKRSLWHSPCCLVAKQSGLAEDNSCTLQCCF